MLMRWCLCCARIAVFSGSFSVLHVAWMVQCFLGYGFHAPEVRRGDPHPPLPLGSQIRLLRQRWQSPALVVLLHLLASLAVRWKVLHLVSTHFWYYWL